MTVHDQERGRQLDERSLLGTLDAVDELVVVCDTDGAVQFWNRAVVERTGLTGEQIGTAGLDALVPDGERDALATAVAIAAETGHSTAVLTLVSGADSSTRYEFEFTRRDDHGQEAAQVVGWGREGTVGPEAVGGDELLDRMTDAFFAMDEQWRFTYVNEQARTVLTNAMAESDEEVHLVGRNYWEAVPDIVDTPFYEAYTQAMETQEPRIVEEYYEPLDSWFEVRIYPSESGLSVYFQDVTERHERESALEEHVIVLQSIYEVTTDRDRSFEAKVERLLAIGREALDLDYGTLSRVEGEEYVFELVDAVADDVEAGDTVPLETTNCERVATEEQTVVLGDVERDAPELVDRAGNADWGIACYLGAPVFVDDSVYGTFCFYDKEPRSGTFSEWERTLVDLMSQWVGQELTRRRTLDRLESQNEELEQFASIVSHDLRNPLNVLVGGLELAEESGDLSELERCHRAADRMEALIEDVLALARAGDRIEATESVQLQTAAERAWDGVATDDATLRVETAAKIRADPSRLRQLLENLFRNAIEHGDADVTVTVGAVQDGFFVADDGPGIPDGEHEQVFETGYSTEADGTGLGLAIVAEICEGHGWSIGSRADDAGARFEITGVDGDTVGD